MSELALTDRESRRLKSLEDNIRQAAGDMYESLRAIHDEKLYRDDYESWEEYCRSRWSMSPQHANRLIEHGKVLCLLDDKSEPMGSLSERATREVAGLPDETKVEVIKQVEAETTPSKGGGKKVTAAAVRAKVRQIVPREPGDESEPTGDDPVTAPKRNTAKPRPAIKELESAVGGVSRALVAAGKEHGEGQHYKSIFDALGGIKRAIAEWMKA